MLLIDKEVPQMIKSHNERGTWYWYVLLLEVSLNICGEYSPTSTIASDRPKVFVALVVRNAEHVLPYVLGGLERQNYPQNRMTIWIRTDCNMDQTSELLKKWQQGTNGVYAAVDLEVLPCSLPHEKYPFAMDDTRARHVEMLRDTAMATSRQLAYDFVMFLDSSSFLVDPSSITDLVDSGRDIIGPFLPSLNKHGNFWCNTSTEGRYIRSEDCTEIFEFQKLGIFDVGLVHGVLMINLKNPDLLDLRFGSEKSDMRQYQQFLLNMIRRNVTANIINKRQYGYSMIPLVNGSTFLDQTDGFRNLQLEVLVYREAIPQTKYITVEEEDPDTLGFDHIYFINLDRRPDRKKRMQNSFQALNMEVERISAVDGEKLNHDLLDTMGISMLPSYEDPHKKRPLTMGEYGCFLSHYAVWRNVVEKGYRQVLVLEDDIRFDYNVRHRMTQVWEDIDRLNLEWDLIYLGRKRLMDDEEPYVKGSQHLVHVSYSYWTLCYMLSSTGAQKLLAGNPLTKMVPVDEYLPIMFDRHPNEEWKGSFENRDLRAFSAYPLLVYPTHYTGEFGYISDTENIAEWGDGLDDGAEEREPISDSEANGRDLALSTHDEL
ncbi:LOW QUALITY PROTEIN: procollagen galactosyltransferase 1-like [Paramacrobiotus metropolitanus]|uniref:LOW QUALITY PROTEIN: procollagen galactosyltransferase 1-like n=1 Tax=Paramacrobiotus metropolitanus TaxID=2943436 RepID=UPI002446142A|nr:LOW QUALITY PROTEIN: procollagen galactosyltransferase 1-like [Paramacrobiotus metropolitanus]